MSIFSEKLKEYIEQKKVSVYALAKSCGMDRSNMYKIVQGTRQPMSVECIENISHTLCLSPFEKSKLLEAWRISRNGEYIYYESKLIFSFIENLQKESLPESPAAKTAQSPSAHSAAGEGTSLTGGHNLDMCLKSMLENEMARSSPLIRMICQPEYDFLYNLLYVYCHENENAEIRHLICLEGITAKQENRYNLNCLNAMAPILMSPCTYKAGYYYDRVQSHFYNMNLFPCMLLTSSCAILMSGDFTYGLLIDAPGQTEMLKKIFDGYMEKSYELLKDGSDFDKIVGEYSWRIDSADNRISMVLSPAPIPDSIPVEMSVRYLKDTASCGVDIKAFMNESQAYMKRSIYAEDYRVFFTEEGLRDFMDNGHIVDMTADSFKLFSKADRLAALENMRKIMSEKNVAAYLIHSDSLKMQRDFYMTVYSDGKCDIMFKNAKSKWRIFSITEKSLGNSFYNFGKYLSESSYACGRNESIECVDKLISEYKKIYKHQEEN